MSDPVSTPARWWENYAVRYLVPTMTGMLFLRWLQLTSPEIFSPIFPAAGKAAGTLSDFHNVTMVELLLWAGGGFAFAYIASLPILVFHATRSLEADQPDVFHLSSPPALTFLLVVATLLAAIAKHFSPSWGPWVPVATLGIVFTFTGVQLFRIYRSIKPRFQAAKYARDVAMARVAEMKWHGDYVTSYRHLREHGNAAFIVLLQAALCTLLYLCLTTSQNLGQQASGASPDWAASSICLLVLVIWIIPSVAVHPLSQRLEAYLRPKPWRAPHTAPMAAVSPQPVPASIPSQAGTHPPVASPNKIKLLLRLLKAASQFSPWLLPLAFCPPILLLWIHLTDLHYPALLMTAIGSTAGLGALLLLGSLIWVMWIMSLALPSMLVAFIATLYGPGNAPRQLAWAWIALGLGAALYCFASTQAPAFVDTIGFFQTFGVLAAIPAITAGCSAPPPLKSSSKELRNWGKLVLGLLVFCIAFLVLCLVLLPLYMVSRAYGKEPDSLFLVVGVITFSFLSALVPGLLFTWLNSRSGDQTVSRMSVSSLAVLLLIPPILSVFWSTAVKMQLSHLTLASSGIVDRGGATSKPGLYRLPDNWSTHDRQLTADFPALSKCGALKSSKPESVWWVCGYRNFSFGSTQLVCDKPYADEAGRFSEGPLTCLTYVGNQVVNLVNLPPPGARR